jgi:methylase of polypeptide subunit release factors
MDALVSGSLSKSPFRTIPSPASAEDGAELSGAADGALLALGQVLKDSSYRFTAITPASHRRVIARERHTAPTVEDIFGWSRPFRAADVAPRILTLLQEAGEVDTDKSWLRSRVRFATLGDQIFIHSAFPTEQPDAVFFGPDTYRFARLLRQSISGLRKGYPLRILDIGAGGGAGGLHAAALLEGGPAIVLTDVNQRALRFCRINAILNGVAGVRTLQSDLFSAVQDTFDLIISNPPYLVDPERRLYRHGGGELGADMSVRIVEEGIGHLAPGGRLVLYTGSAIVDGVDRLYETLRQQLAGRAVRFDYEEIDPDVFGEELAHFPYDTSDRIAAVGITVDAL